MRIGTGKALWCLSLGRDARACAPPFPAGNAGALKHAFLPSAWRRRDEAAFREFCSRFFAAEGEGRGEREERILRGVLVHLSAQWLAEEDEEPILKKACLLAARLNELRRAANARPAVFIVIDGIDRLYGWRSVAAALPEERRARALGGLLDPPGLLRPDGRSAPGGRQFRQSVDSLVDAAEEEALRLAFFSDAPSPPFPSLSPAPARLQAGPEFSRVAGRLRFFAKQFSAAAAAGFFSGAPDAPDASGVVSGSASGGAVPHGIFFGSSLPDLPALPPFAAAPSFLPVEEKRSGRQGLFLDQFFADILPSALRRHAGGRGRFFAGGGRRGALLHAAAAALLLASLCAGWLMTSSFSRTRSILLSASGAAAHPESPAQLGTYLRLAESAAARSADDSPARLGMTEDKALAAELQRRFTESYFDLKAVPGIDRLQDNALAAVRTGGPEALGNALLMLVLARDSLSAAMGEQALPEERLRFLRNVAFSLGLADEDETRQLRAFFEWAKNRGWMPKTRDALLRFERHITASDPIGSWLPRWAESVVRALGGDAAQEQPEGVAPAWTWRSHAIAKELAEAAASDGTPAPSGAPPPWSAAALAEYGKNALAAWLGAASALWENFPASVSDADIPDLLRRAAEGDDPASRFTALAAENLLPMFDGADSAAANGAGSAAGVPAEILWLRHRREALPGESPGVAAETANRARALTALWNERAGASVWPTLSPLAIDLYARHLRARQDALALDAEWVRTVYTPWRLTPGGGDSRRDRLVRAGGLLENFLTGPADGRWVWLNGRVENARRDSVAFGFSREFLDFCNAVLANGRVPARAELPLALSVDSVNISGGSGGRVLERPVAVEFRLGPGKAAQSVVYRNYPVSGEWVWTPSLAEAALTIVFPSHTASIPFAGAEELRMFFTLFGEGSRLLAPEDFGASAPVLRRLGVDSVMIRATLSPLPDLLAQLSRTPVPPLPQSIVEIRGARR